MAGQRSELRRATLGAGVITIGVLLMRLHHINWSDPGYRAVSDLLDLNCLSARERVIPPSLVQWPSQFGPFDS